MAKKHKKRDKRVEQFPAPEIKLDLGCGQNRKEGFTGVDFYAPGEGIVKCDLFKSPWCAPGSDKLLWKDESVSEIHASHFVEHIPYKLRWPFFDECYRVLKPGGKMQIIVPNWKSERAYGDMTHEWPAVVSMAFYYLNKGWRDANKLTYGDYDLKCNFEHAAGPTGMDGDFNGKTQEVVLFACKHYMESYPDMWVNLTKLPMA